VAEPSADIPVVILCGGRGLRMSGRDQALPKPLVEVGSRPILWHVMAIYAAQGFRTFVLCLGFQGELIAEKVSGFSEVTGGSLLDSAAEELWNVVFADTGVRTPTGGRVARVADRLAGGTFFLTYADGVADIGLGALVAFHRSHGAAATITVVRPENPWGVAELDGDDRVQRFHEKPRLDSWVNGGFFVMESAALDRIGLDDVLEREPLERLAAAGELRAYRHEGFWECMDTYKDTQHLNDLWDQGAAPWRGLVAA
jgi:glucose-1-phosphate cytidylyltransferase